jgi:tetratricopeptide (TPR) repeat protein
VSNPQGKPNIFTKQRNTQADTFDQTESING